MKGNPTLCSVFENHYLPLRLADATTRAIELYRLILRRWKRVTADPPVTKITPDVLAEFVAELRDSRGIKRHGKSAPNGKMSVNTIRGYLRAVQTLLDFCGPRGRRCRDALGILREPPWIRPPRPSLGAPRVVPLERLSKVYQAAGGMKFPKLGRIRPSTWWRCFLATAFNLGLRRGTLLQFSAEEIDWESGLLEIPAHRMKSRRAHVLPLNETATEHLRRICNDSGTVFKWPLRSEALLDHLYRLEDRAGIPREERFGLQDIRSTAGTIVAQVSSPEVARAFLAHAATDTAMRHYINAHGLLAKAVAAMPQPKAFLNGKH